MKDLTFTTFILICAILEIKVKKTSACASVFTEHSNQGCKPKPI